MNKNSVDQNSEETEARGQVGKSGRNEERIRDNQSYEAGDELDVQQEARWSESGSVSQSSGEADTQATRGPDSESFDQGEERSSAVSKTEVWNEATDC